MDYKSIRSYICKEYNSTICTIIEFDSNANIRHHINDDMIATDISIHGIIESFSAIYNIDPIMPKIYSNNVRVYKDNDGIYHDVPFESKEENFVYLLDKKYKQADIFEHCIANVPIENEQKMTFEIPDCICRVNKYDNLANFIDKKTSNLIGFAKMVYNRFTKTKYIITVNNNIETNDFSKTVINCNTGEIIYKGTFKNDNNINRFINEYPVEIGFLGEKEMPIFATGYYDYLEKENIVSDNHIYKDSNKQGYLYMPNIRYIEDYDLPENIIYNDFIVLEEDCKYFYRDIYTYDENTDLDEMFEYMYTFE